MSDRCLCPDFELRGQTWEIWTDSTTRGGRLLIDPRKREVVDTDRAFDPPLVERVARAMWRDDAAPLPWRKLTKGSRAYFYDLAEAAITETVAALRESGRLVEWQEAHHARHAELVLVHGPIIDGVGERVGVGMLCASWGGWWTRSIDGKLKSCAIKPVLIAKIPAPPATAATEGK